MDTHHFGLLDFFFFLPFFYVIYGEIEHKYVTFQSHKNLEKKGYYKMFDKKCQKNQNFKFCPKLPYFVPLLPFLYFLHINRFTLHIRAILFNLKDTSITLHCKDSAQYDQFIFIFALYECHNKTLFLQDFFQNLWQR